MEKEFVNYELALRMKALGFDESCFGWMADWNKQPHLGKHEPSHHHKSSCNAITWQSAFRWFREKYNLNGILNHYPNTKLWDFSVHDLTWSGKEFIEHVKKEDRSVKYSTYEEAELACLNKLIEIVEQKEKYD